jgi:hypothetical protein
LNRIPFSVYDFFGYLASGFILVAAVDLSLDRGWLLGRSLELVSGILLVAIAYVLGHVIASLSSFLLEWSLTREVLGSPEERLFRDEKGTWRARLLPGYFRPLPQKTRGRVLEKAKEKAGIGEPDRALFLHCHSLVKREQAVLERLNAFLNLYGFCRNVSMASLLSVLFLLVGGEWWWALAAAVVALAMFHRYLKFFRHYTAEVFVSYAEVDDAAQDTLPERW